MSNETQHKFNGDITVGGAVASWLASSSLDQAAWVRALAGTLCCVPGQDTLLSRCPSPPRSINAGELYAEGNPEMD